MRNYDMATADYLAGRAGMIARTLAWISARNIETGATETIGLWTGEENASFSIEGVSRNYAGAGGLLQLDAITASAGLAVRTVRLEMSAIAPEVEGLAKAYDTRFAPIELHRAFYDPGTRQLVSEPHRIFRGLVNSIDFDTAAVGGAPACSVEMVSETRLLTRALALKKSDETHRATAGDRFRRYGDISGAVPVYWGEKRVAEAPAITVGVSTGPEEKGRSDGD